MDNQQRQNKLAENAEIAVGIIGNPTTNDVVMVELGGPVPTSAQFAGRGLRFCGALGMIDGVVHVESEPDAGSMRLCAQAVTFFLQYAEQRRSATPHVGRAPESMAEYVAKWRKFAGL